MIASSMLPQPVLFPVPDSDDLWSFEEPFEICLPFSCKTLRVEKTFKTDGASIPRFLWMFIGHPFDPDYVSPCCGVHDPLYSSKLLPRKISDKELLMLMKLNGKASAKKAELFYKAVRMFGWFTWIMKSPLEVCEARNLVSIR